MIARGIYPPPAQFEAWVLSSAHTAADVDKTIAAAREAMREVKKQVKDTKENRGHKGKRS